LTRLLFVICWAPHTMPQEKRKAYKRHEAM